ncbi:MAG: pyridoxal phosphate-dependent aminotransferase [Armatimonadota bacterium]
MLSTRVSQIQPSPTVGLASIVRELRDRGEDVVSFGAGEPDFDTPEPIREAGVRAIQDGHTHYTPGPGLTELREAIAKKLLRENGVHAEVPDIVVSCGAKQAVFNALMALCDPGDEVILLAPYWMTYKDQIVLAGGVPVVVHTRSESGFVPDMDAIRAAVTPKTKAIVINSPTNPTGGVFPRSILKEIAALALRQNLYVISDEIYEKHVYDGAEHVSIASLGREIADRTVTVGGFSKSHAMTGWRLGYSVSNREIASSISKIQDQVTSNACSISQYAALAAFEESEADVDAMVLEFSGRRNVLLSAIAEIPGVRCHCPLGAFYLFPDVSEAIQGKLESDVALAEYLLREHKVACVPGSVFEGPGHIRLTYALSSEQMLEGAKRIADGLGALS